MYLGVDYYPHYFDDTDLDKDLDNIKALHANIIRIGDFTWQFVEPSEGVYQFDYFKEVIQKAAKRNIDVMVCTPTSTFPAWLKHRYPEILLEDQHNQKVAFGGRREYCYNSDIYLHYSKIITLKMVEAYKDFENVISFQVDNEFGHEGSDQCYCKNCERKFQQYLQEKYQTIENLNAHAGNIFWAKSYTAFEQIEVLRPTITYHNPFMSLEWKRFRHHSITQFGLALIEVIKQAKRPDQTVTHNYFPGFFKLSYDQNELSQALDFVSYDNYPVWGGLREPVEPAQIALTHDYIRGLKNKNYWIVEQIMGAQGHDVIGYLPRKNQSKMWAYQAFAHGCENLLFFSYRTAAKGQEQFCYGLLDQDNINKRRYFEAQDFFKNISQHADKLTSPICSRVAIVYDFNNIWAWETQRQSHKFDFMNEILRVYRGFYQHNVNIDVINIDKDFSQYDILVFPVMQILDEALSQKIHAAAAQKKSIIFTYRSGLKDIDGNVHLNSTAPNLIHDLVGAKVIEIEALQDGQESEIILNGKVCQMDTFREILELDQAQSLANYSLDEFESNIAISKNDYFGSQIYYIAGGIDSLGMKMIAKKCLSYHNIPHIESPEGVEIIHRQAGSNDVAFCINHTNLNVSLGAVSLAPYEVKINVSPKDLQSTLS